jgi:hypothetical protein
MGQNYPSISITLFLLVHSIHKNKFLSQKFLGFFFWDFFGIFLVGTKLGQNPKRVAAPYFSLAQRIAHQLPHTIDRALFNGAQYTAVGIVIKKLSHRFLGFWSSWDKIPKNFIPLGQNPKWVFVPIGRPSLHRHGP